MTRQPKAAQHARVSGIGILINPRSRRNLRDPGAGERLARIVGPLGRVRTASTLGELRDIAAEFSERDIDVLAISGGDGTNHVTLGGFIKAYGDKPLPPIAFLRGGTMNTVANAVGVRRGSPERLLERLAKAVGRNEPLRSVTRRLMRVGDDYGFLFGAGAIHGFLAEYYRDGEPSPRVAAKTLARGAASALIGGETATRIAEPLRGSIEYDDTSGRHHRWPEREYLAVGAGTVDQIGLGFRPFHRSAGRVDAFHLLGIHATPAGLVRELPRIWRAAPMRPETADDAAAVRAVIHPSGGVTRYMIDGDLFEAPGPLSVSLGPSISIVTLR